MCYGQEIGAGMVRSFEAFLGGIVGRLDRTSKADSFATSGLFYSELFLSPGELGRIH